MENTKWMIQMSDTNNSTVNQLIQYACIQKYFIHRKAAVLQDHLLHEEW